MHNLSAILIGLGMLSASAELFEQPTCVRHDPPTENIASQLSKFKQVQMAAATDGLTQREKQLVQKLVDASRLIESIYWRQSDLAGLALYKGLGGCTGKTERDIRHFLVINGSRYDLLEEHKPFIGRDPYPPGRESYPKGITQKEIDSYVAAHPDKKAEIYHPQTVVKRQG